METLSKRQIQREMNFYKNIDHFSSVVFQPLFFFFLLISFWCCIILGFFLNDFKVGIIGSTCACVLMFLFVATLVMIEKYGEKHEEKWVKYFLSEFSSTDFYICFVKEYQLKYNEYNQACLDFAKKHQNKHDFTDSEMRGISPVCEDLYIKEKGLSEARDLFKKEFIKFLSNDTWAVSQINTIWDSLDNMVNSTMPLIFSRCCIAPLISENIKRNGKVHVYYLDPDEINRKYTNPISKHFSTED